MHVFSKSINRPLRLLVIICAQFLEISNKCQCNINAILRGKIWGSTPEVCNRLTHRLTQLALDCSTDLVPPGLHTFQNPFSNLWHVCIKTTPPINASCFYSWSYSEKHPKLTPCLTTIILMGSPVGVLIKSDLIYTTKYVNVDCQWSPQTVKKLIEIRISNRWSEVTS